MSLFNCSISGKEKYRSITLLLSVLSISRGKLYERKTQLIYESLRPIHGIQARATCITMILGLGSFVFCILQEITIISGTGDGEESTSSDCQQRIRLSHMKQESSVANTKDGQRQPTPETTGRLEFRHLHRLSQSLVFPRQSRKESLPMRETVTNIRSKRVIYSQTFCS